MKLLKKSPNLFISAKHNKNSMLTQMIQKEIILRGVLRLIVSIKKVLLILKTKFVDSTDVLFNFIKKTLYKAFN